MAKLIKYVGAWTIAEVATDPRYPDDTVFQCIYDHLCYDQFWSLREAERFCETHPKKEIFTHTDMDFDF